MLNVRGSSFSFVFPKGFFPEVVSAKYESYFKKQPGNAYDTIQQYVNSTIQSVGFPSMSIDSVEQIRNLGKRVSYQSATPVQDLFSKEFSVSFRVVEGYFNYFIMLETVLEHLNFKNGHLYFQNLPMRILDNNGNILVTVNFKEVIVSSVSQLSFNYTANNPQVTNFEVGFKCNYLDIDLEVSK